MNAEDLRAHARSLVFAMEMGAGVQPLLEGSQKLVRDLGGTIDVRTLQPGSAAIYLVALFFSHIESRG